MRFAIFILWTSALLGEVHALNNALPFEVLNYYYSYKAEYKLNPSMGRLIGFNCEHKKDESLAGQAVELAILAQGLEGICTFDEFTRNILIEQRKPLYTVGGTGLTIDPDSSVRTNFPGPDKPQFLYDITELLPTYAPAAGEEKLPLEKAIDLVGSAVDRARYSAQANTGALSEVDTMLEKAIGYIKIATQYRIGDQYNPKIKSLGSVKGNAVRLPTIEENKPATTILDIDGTSLGTYANKAVPEIYYNIDIKATIANANPPLTASHKEALLKWSKNGFPGTNGNDITHSNVLKSLNTASSHLSSTDFRCWNELPGFNDFPL
jgi:hypothetical protein